MMRPGRWPSRSSCSPLGSILAGYVGIPHALGGHNGLATWLEPAFQATNCGAPVTTGELAGHGDGGVHAGRRSGAAATTPGWSCR